jgi:hypothetical protein
MRIEIQLSKWYAKGNVEEFPIDDVNWRGYAPYLENPLGQRCCLGFCAIAHGAAPCDIIGEGEPWTVARQLLPEDWMLTYHVTYPSPRSPANSDLAELAMHLNDGYYEWTSQDLPTRMGNLITVFAEGGDDLQFINDDQTN